MEQLEMRASPYSQINLYSSLTPRVLLTDSNISKAVRQDELRFRVI